MTLAIKVSGQLIIVDWGLELRADGQEMSVVEFCLSLDCGAKIRRERSLSYSRR